MTDDNQQSPDVSPEELRGYLDASGAWQAIDRSARRSIYEHAEGERVYVPEWVGSDYDLLLARLVEVLAGVENRSPTEVRAALNWRRFDQLHVTRLTEDPSLAFDDGIEMHQALFDLVKAAARSSVEPKPWFGRGKFPASVTDFVGRVRLLPSAPGSFVVRALLPVEPPSDQWVLELPGFVDANMRRASEMILAASAHAVDTAKKVAVGDAELDAWEEAVPSGVSANLCDALVRLVGDDEQRGSAELGVVWAWGERRDDHRVVVPAGLAPTLGAAATYLREGSEDFEIRATGQIVTLHREATTGPGATTLRGVIEGYDSERNVRVTLDEQTYHEAVVAHDEGRIVIARLRVRLAPRGFEVLQVLSWSVLTDD